MPSAIASCANHPDREAMGLCVKCRRLVCTECVTRLDGINHCVSCLAPRPSSGSPRKADAALAGDRTFAVLLATLAFGIVLWGVFEALLPG